jgi:hypothetical protein
LSQQQRHAIINQGLVFNQSPGQFQTKCKQQKNIVGDWKPSLVSMNGGRWVSAQLALGRAPASQISTDKYIQ